VAVSRHRCPFFHFAEFLASSAEERKYSSEIGLDRIQIGLDRIQIGFDCRRQPRSGNYSFEIGLDRIQIGFRSEIAAGSRGAEITVLRFRQV